MPDLSHNDLLQPSLSGARPRLAPYSSQAGFLVSFFGGPLAACALGALNAQRIGQMPRDLPWLAAVALLYVGLQWWVGQTALGQQALADLIGALGSGAESLANKFLGLLVFGLVSLLQRSEQKAATLMGLDRPNGLWLGLVLIGVGRGLIALLEQVMR